MSWLTPAILRPGGIIGSNFGRGTPSAGDVSAVMKRTPWVRTIHAALARARVRGVVRAHVLGAEREVTDRFVIGSDDAPAVPQVVGAMRRTDPSILKPLMVMPASCPLPPLEGATFAPLVGTPRTLTSAPIASAGTGMRPDDHGRAKRDLGWRPETAVERALAVKMAELRARAWRGRRVAPPAAGSAAPRSIRRPRHRDAIPVTARRCAGRHPRPPSGRGHRRDARSWGAGTRP